MENKTHLDEIKFDNSQGWLYNRIILTKTRTIMTNTMIVGTITFFLALGIGATCGYMYKTLESKGLVEIHVTRTGSFILQKDKIFTVSELQTDEVRYGTLSHN